ncbi:MAG: ferrous iron transport protein B [Candidatus Latescibacteria bacterium]|nr:ferrous iron transport protein B [Candidatus Latescibacterota bacterium]
MPTETDIEPLIALAGSPNTGKTTLFNRLTGLSRKVGNFPGVTIARSEGELRLPGGTSARLIDLPGAYSLQALSPEERIARQILRGEAGEARPDLVVAVVAAPQLSRHLFLVTQLKELGIPVIVALNMVDEARSEGVQIDVKRLEEELGLPVVACSARTGEGIEDLLHTIQDRDRWPRLPDTWQDSDDPGRIVGRYRDVQRMTDRSRATHSGVPRSTLVLDRILTHVVAGPLIFLGVMALVFQSIFTWSGPAMDLITAGFDRLAAAVVALLGEGMLSDLLADGVIAGVGSVLVFLPQILLLFFFISLLEESGYMARAAYLMDRLMGWVGLSGKAFLPLMSSAACAIPGIMATRTIEDSRDRLATILVAPLITCSARLPVYALIIHAFIPARPVWGIFDYRSLTLLALYLGGLLSAFTMAFIFKRTLLKGRGVPLLIEMPSYRTPHWRNVGMELWTNGRSFVERAGSVILAICIVLWFLGAYPKADPLALQRLPPEERATAQIDQSLLGSIGRGIEPALRPLGFDWKIGIGILTSFAAREVFVGTMGVVYGVGKESDENSESLQEKFQNARRPDGSKVFTFPVVLSLLTFYMLACQCGATLGVVRRETGGWKWPLFMFSYMSVLAYTAAFLVRVGATLAGG